MNQLYQDAMTIVRKCSKPDLFITFTCNPLWGDITSCLLPEKKTTDRPDLIVRVFKLKLRELLNNILKRHVLGEPLAHVYTIESQMRGLPHALILIILADDCKPREPSDYDKIVCAEIPDPNIDPILSPTLHRIVKRCMIHGPCVLPRKELLACEMVHALNIFLKDSLPQLLPLKMVSHYIGVERIPVQ